MVVEPAVLTGQQYVRQLVEVAQACGGLLEVVVTVWAFLVEVGMFAWVRAPLFYMIDFRVENLYVYQGGVGMLDFEHAVMAGTRLSRLGEAFVQFLKDAASLLPPEVQDKWPRVYSSVRSVSPDNYSLDTPHGYFQDFTAYVHHLFDVGAGAQPQVVVPRPPGGFARTFRQADVGVYFWLVSRRADAVGLATEGEVMADLPASPPVASGDDHDASDASGDDHDDSMGAAVDDHDASEGGDPTEDGPVILVRDLGDDASWAQMPSGLGEPLGGPWYDIDGDGM